MLTASIRYFNKLAIAWILLSLLSASYASETEQPVQFRIMTEDFPPFSYQDSEGNLKGAAVEITQMLLKRMKHPDNIQILPWARAYRDIRDKRNSQMLFAMARTPEREPLFKWIGPILTDTVYFYQHHKNPQRFQRLEELKALPAIAVTRDFPEHRLLLQKDFDNLVLTTNPEQNIALLMRQRVAVTVAGAAIINSLLRHSGYSPDQVKRIELPLFSTDLYIAVSKQTPDPVIQQWQIQFDELKKTPLYQTVLQRYGLN